MALTIVTGDATIPLKTGAYSGHEDMYGFVVLAGRGDITSSTAKNVTFVALKSLDVVASSVLSYNHPASGGASLTTTATRP